MSEYQYYEFQTLDRPLTAEEQKAVKKLSSHITVSSTSAHVDYSWGNFKHDPAQVVARYFDAMLYTANWGSRRLIFRFPKAVVETKLWQPYLTYSDALSLQDDGDYVILDINLPGEGDSDWIEDDGLLSKLVPLRNDLLRGDLRVLYLAAVHFALYDSDDHENTEYSDEDEEEENATFDDYGGGSFRIKVPPGRVEPPVPPGLQKLTPALRSFIEFFAINPDLVTSAAEASPPLSEQSEDLAGQLPLLTAAEKNDFLVRLLRGNPRVDLALAARLRALRPGANAAAQKSPRRTLQMLIAAAEAQEKRRQAEAQRKEDEVRLKKMQVLAPQELKLWLRVHELIALKNIRSCDEAIEILKDLRVLAIHQQHTREFEAKIADIRARYPTLSGLQKRLDKVS